MTICLACDAKISSDDPVHTGWVSVHGRHTDPITVWWGWLCPECWGKTGATVEFVKQGSLL